MSFTGFSRVIVPEHVVVTQRRGYLLLSKLLLVFGFKMYENLEKFPAKAAVLFF